VGSNVYVYGGFNSNGQQQSLIEYANATDFATATIDPSVAPKQVHGMYLCMCVCDCSSSFDRVSPCACNTNRGLCACQ
jgi:hypothetical protein